MKKATAFSLAEISVVILIIGILIAAISQTQAILKKAKLTNAQSLTKNSPVIETEGVLLWYETSLKTSFDVGNIEDGSSISVWYDNNEKSLNKIHATQATVNYQPQYYHDSFNGAIPGLRFDGSNDYMDFDGSSLIESSYTIFTVGKRNGNTARSYFIAGSSITTDENLHLGYDNNQIRLAHYGNGYTVSIPSFTSPRESFFTFQFANGSNKRFSINGGNWNYPGSAQPDPITDYPNSSLGRHIGANFFYGDMAEIIIFNRYLTTAEVKVIEQYLSKKYNIKVDSEA